MLEHGMSKEESVSIAHASCFMSSLSILHDTTFSGMDSMDISWFAKNCNLNQNWKKLIKGDTHFYAQHYVSLVLEIDYWLFHDTIFQIEIYAL